MNSSFQNLKIDKVKIKKSFKENLQKLRFSVTKRRADTITNNSPLVHSQNSLPNVNIVSDQEIQDKNKNDLNQNLINFSEQER